MRLLLDLQGAQSESRFRGIGRHTRALAAAIVELARERHDVRILLNGMLGANLPDLRAQFSQLIPAERIHVFSGVSPAAAHDPDNDWRTRASELARHAFIDAFQPDILHVSSLFEGYLDDASVSIRPGSSRYSVCTTLYDLIPLIRPQTYLTDPQVRAYYYRRVGMLTRSHMLLALTESVKREAVAELDFDPDRIVVTGCGLESHFVRLPPDPARDAAVLYRYGIPRKFVLHVGAVDARKNVELLLEAFCGLPSALRASHCLVFAGKMQEPEIAQVRALGARFGLRHKELVFSGLVPEQDLVVLYNAAALVVCPSRHEGFGLPVLESMSCGTPVLASDCTSHPEVVGNPDQLFDPGSADELGAKMAEVIGDPRVALAFREFGLQRAALWTWQQAAGRALVGFEQLHEQKSHLAVPAHAVALARRERPLMAFLSPLPDARTGVAVNSGALLRELAKHYEIECIVDAQPVTDDWIKANLTLRDIGWFERNAQSYDRIVYAVGNSHFHAHLIGLLRRHPGTVILHDFFMGDLLEYMSNTGEFAPDTFTREVYLSHGLSALCAIRDDGVRRAVERFPCNGFIFRNAVGVVAYSEQVRTQAREWFGPDAARGVEVVPHLHRLFVGDRVGSRQELGLDPASFVVCSFGLVTSRKEGQRLMAAWAASRLGNAPNAVLVFVGQAIDTYGEELERQIAEFDGRSRVLLTGYASPRTYEQYLSACDAAVQLRRLSRVETSGAILDCLAAGVPVVANAHGTTADYPDSVLLKIPDAFTAQELTDALDRLQAEPELGRQLGARGRRYVADTHHPSLVGKRLHETIERFAAESPATIGQRLVAEIGDLAAKIAPSEEDTRRLAVAIASNTTRIGLRTLFCDVTVLAEQDARTGIQRVVRSVFTTLVADPPPGFRIEAVRLEQGKYLIATQFAEQLLGVPAAVFQDSEAVVSAGDVFLGLDWVPDRLPEARAWLTRFRALGGRIAFVVYDLLPLHLPQHFPDFMPDATLRWFSSILAVADQVIGISRAVADDVANFAGALEPGRTWPLAIDFFHIGGDLAASVPTTGITQADRRVLDSISKQKSFLMVGTLEPRKGHLQVLRAFDVLWAEGRDVALVIVGKRGWMVEATAALLECHAERNKRLFWLENTSDEVLGRLYGSAAALIAASAGEGFGLPLIEAAEHAIPVIARDLPVFREVAGEHAFYFAGETASDLAAALKRWLGLAAKGHEPSSRAMPHQSWRTSVSQLLTALLGGQPYRTIEPSDAQGSRSGE